MLLKSLVFEIMMSSYFSFIVERHHDQSDLQKKAFNVGLRVPEGGRARDRHVGVRDNTRQGLANREWLRVLKLKAHPYPK